jgi:acetolactate synthase-1/2/3 large subunit
MLSLEDPTLDWPAMARGHGVSASRVETAEALVEALRRGFASGEPTLIEAVL